MSLHLSRSPEERVPPTARVPSAHEAWYYRGDDELLARSAEFVLDGLEADDAVCVLLPRGHLDALRSELGSAAAAVTWAPMDEVGRNPGRILGRWTDLIDQHAPLRRVRGIGEPAYAGRSNAELVECRHLETLLDVGLRGTGAWIACAYDVESVPDDTLAGVRAVHRGDHDVDDLLGEPLSRPPREHSVARFGRRDLAAVRRFLRERIEGSRLAPARQDELVLAVSELVANSVRHGGGEGTIRLWRDARAHVVEVHDAGRIEDPMVGRRCPPPDGTGGRGVWMVHHLCDLVQLRSGPGGTTVRVRVDCD